MTIRHPSRRVYLAASATTAALVGLPALVDAQAFPGRPIKYICPWPAGGSPHVTMRAIAVSAGKSLGQAIVTENKSGAGTSPHLAVEEFAKRAGIKLTHLPFKRNADNMQAVLGGHIMAAPAMPLAGGRRWTRANCACWPPMAANAPDAGPTCQPSMSWAATPSPIRLLAYVAPKT